MIRKRNFKCFWHWQGEQILYDLDADPGETRNVAPAHGRLVQELLHQLILQLKRPMLDFWVNPRTT